MAKSSVAPFMLHCEDEELSEAQITHHKKQMEDLHLLQGALQLQFNISKDGDINTPNGGPLISVLQNFPSVENPNPSQYLQLIMSKKGDATKTSTDTNNVSSSSQTKKTNVAPEPPQPPKPSLTQVLRATRKSTGTLPPPRVNLAEDDDDDDDPEIEVIQEKRASTTIPKQLPSTSGPAGFRKIFPKPAVKRMVPPNNLLLLNINVRPRNLASASVNATQRKDLDAKVKVVLIKSPAEFVEWLLKQGLIRSQQLCTTHKYANRTPTKLKLGMFEDPSALTSSGGYVWVSECCGRKYVSVYSGSLFGSTPIDNVPPTSVLKLIYHWSCQTSIANVETWVKVDRQFISKIYNYLRCICSIILHDKIYDFGFERTAVELGIVSLGTTTADGSRKAVKVEILGLYDRKNKSYRLFVSTPEPASSSRERFMRILKPVREVIHRNAIIICDQSVDPACLNAMNYTRVEVCSSSDDENDLRTNSTIMYYLRKHIPKMFQTSLSQLTENQVQLILDELVWREKFAPTSASCFENIMENIAYITYREMENPGVIPLMEYVANYPHNNFRYKNQLPNKVIPSVPASVILTLTSNPPAVVPTQHTDLKFVSPANHVNKVMTKNIQYAQDFMSKEPSQAAITIKNLNSLADRIVSNIAPQSFLLQSQSQPSAASPHKLPELVDGVVDLEPYFYGHIDGNNTWGQEQNSCVFKCHICSETFEDNVAFYTHLKYHNEGITAGKDKLDLMCSYCCRHFDNHHAVNRHKIDVHLMSDLTLLWCRICTEKFPTENLLKSHMVRVHVESELPYRCEVCHYATSFYYDIINHFNKNHFGTPYVQCHYCLQIKTITPNGAMSFSTRMFQHMQKHIQMKLSCKSCILIYYSKYLLNEHKKEHLSCAKVNGVIKYQSVCGYRSLQFNPACIPNTLRPSPVTLNTKSQIALSQTLAEQSNLWCSFDDNRYYCIECDAPLHTENHYKKYRVCNRCTYSTCCPNMIMKHVQVFHPPNSSKTLNYFIGNPVPLPNEMFCYCGFSTKSGHHLARHLAMCNKKTAYPLLPPEVVEELCMSPAPDEEMDVEDDYPDEMPILPLSVELEEE